MTLLARAWMSLLVLGALMGAALFGAARTFDYWQGWVYLAIFVGASGATTVDLAKRDPALLERRMRGGPSAEREPAQRVIMLLATLSFIALIVVPALDRRWHWSAVPVAVVVLGDLLSAAGFVGIMRVYRENTYAAATIQVAAGQAVISTGPYAIVRHPMYATALLYVLGTPLALASYYGLIVVALLLAVLIARLLNEEQVLARDLPGYREYRRRVRWRLIPGVW
jgi:protein-S-isoprenylcysteine O-methyltransferase Ste14